MGVNASSSGYPYDFIPYMEKEVNSVELFLGSRVVLGLLDVVENKSQHSVYFDNFTLYKLLQKLRSFNIRATETVRENRMLKCLFPATKAFVKQPRGYFVVRSSEGLVAVKWNDNACVYLASNHDNSYHHVTT